MDSTATDVNSVILNTDTEGNLHGGLLVRGVYSVGSCSHDNAAFNELGLYGVRRRRSDFFADEQRRKLPHHRSLQIVHLKFNACFVNASLTSVSFTITSGEL